MSKFVIAQQAMSIPYVSTNYASAGMMRCVNGIIEVYNGVGWESIRLNWVDVLSVDARDTLEWANKKMMEEQSLDQLCERYPALKSARDNFNVVRVLVESEEKNAN